jgi:hypothetical protein
MPTSTINLIKEHLQTTFASKPKKTFNKKEFAEITKDCTLAIVNLPVVPVMCTNCTDITGTTLLENIDNEEIVAEDLIKVASDASIFKL